MSFFIFFNHLYVHYTYHQISIIDVLVDKQIHPGPSGFDLSEKQGCQIEDQEPATSDASFLSHSEHSYIGKA